jgi:hypothetical protein
MTPTLESIVQRVAAVVFDIYENHPENVPKLEAWLKAHRDPRFVTQQQVEAYLAKEGPMTPSATFREFTASRGDL